MIVSLVVAVAENGVIGRNGGLPWRNPSELKTFRRLTMGKPVVMGRKTFQSLPKVLDGRDNIIVTSDADFSGPGAHVVTSLADALGLGAEFARDRGVDEVCVIGGAMIFRDALPLAGRIYWTEVHGHPEGDVVFPQFDRTQWREISHEALQRGERDEFAWTLRILERAP